MFKEITKHEQLSGKKLGVSISVQLDRMPTNDEMSLSHKFTQDMMNLMYRNNCLQDKVYMENIAQTKRDILACFPSNIYVKEIENGYSKNDIEPWYIVTTSKGPIEIGWRKSVISINWRDSDIKERAEQLFTSEDVTKYDQLIHAWGYEKAKEYITKLLNL